MIQVTKEQFYQVIFEMNLDVHPSPDKVKTVWVYPRSRTREVFGESSQGYIPDHTQEEKYFIK